MAASSSASGSHSARMPSLCASRPPELSAHTSDFLIKPNAKNDSQSNKNKRCQLNRTHSQQQCRQWSIPKLSRVKAFMVQNQHARELINAQKSSHKRNNKDRSCLRELSPGMRVNARYINSTRGTSSNL